MNYQHMPNDSVQHEFLSAPKPPKPINTSCKPTAEVAHFAVAAFFVLAFGLEGLLSARVAAIVIFLFGWIKEMGFDFALGDDTLTWAVIDALFYTVGAIVGILLVRFA